MPSEHIFRKTNHPCSSCRLQAAALLTCVRRSTAVWTFPSNAARTLATRSSVACSVASFRLMPQCSRSACTTAAGVPRWSSRTRRSAGSSTSSAFGPLPQLLRGREKAAGLAAERHHLGLRAATGGWAGSLNRGTGPPLSSCLCLLARRACVFRQLQAPRSGLTQNSPPSRTPQHCPGPGRVQTWQSARQAIRLGEVATQRWQERQHEPTAQAAPTCLAPCC